IPITVLAGQEVRINGDMIDDLENGELLPLHRTKYLFVEFPSGHIPRYAQQMLFDIQVAGYTPIIVHPERNRELMEHPDRLYESDYKGALTQVNAASVVDKFDKKIQKFTHQLIEAELTDFIATDAHNTTRRGFCMQEAFQVVKEQYGAESYYMF